MIKDIINDKVLPIVLKFVNLKGVIALRDGMMFILPLTLVGSLFLLLCNIPIPEFNLWLVNILGENWKEPLLQAYGSTFAIIALISAVGIAYVYVKNEGYEPLGAGVISLVVFLITSNSYVITESGEKVSDIIPKTWTGGEGMITAIIIGLLVGAIYSWFMKKDIRIKMPEGVPPGISNAFSSLIPAAAIILGATIVYTLFKVTLDTTLAESIYKLVQTPLQGITDSLGGIIVMSFLISFLWWFGIHGATLLGGVVQGVLISNATANQAIIDSGKALTMANGAHIVTQQFLDLFVNMSGSGITIGLVVCMLFFSKSAQFKQLGKLAIVPSFFNINEPVMFGTPIVMNPFMAVPFIVTPVVIAIMLYFAIFTGLMPPFSGVLIPWTTPPIIAGFLLSGVRGAIFQIITMVISVVIYYPFFKKEDNLNFLSEQEMAKETVKSL